MFKPANDNIYYVSFIIPKAMRLDSSDAVSKADMLLEIIEAAKRDNHAHAGNFSNVDLFTTQAAYVFKNSHHLPLNLQRANIKGKNPRGLLAVRVTENDIEHHAMNRRVTNIDDSVFKPDNIAAIVLPSDNSVKHNIFDDCKLVAADPRSFYMAEISIQVKDEANQNLSQQSGNSDDFLQMKF